MLFKTSKVDSGQGSFGDFFDSLGCRHPNKAETCLLEKLNIKEIRNHELVVLRNILQSKQEPIREPSQWGYKKAKRSSSVEIHSWTNILQKQTAERALKRIRTKMTQEIAAIWQSFHSECLRNGTWLNFLQKNYLIKTILASLFAIQASSTELMNQGAQKTLEVLKNCLNDARNSNEPSKFKFIQVIHQIRLAMNGTLAFVSIQRVLTEVQAEFGGERALFIDQHGLEVAEEKSATAPRADSNFKEKLLSQLKLVSKQTQRGGDSSG